VDRAAARHSPWRNAPRPATNRVVAPELTAHDLELSEFHGHRAAAAHATRFAVSEFAAACATAGSEVARQYGADDRDEPAQAVDRAAEARRSA